MCKAKVRFGGTGNQDAARLERAVRVLNGRMEARVLKGAVAKEAIESKIARMRSEIAAVRLAAEGDVDLRSRENAKSRIALLGRHMAALQTALNSLR